MSMGSRSRGKLEFPNVYGRVSVVLSKRLVRGMAGVSSWTLGGLLTRNCQRSCGKALRLAGWVDGSGGGVGAEAEHEKGGGHQGVAAAGDGCGEGGVVAVGLAFGAADEVGDRLEEGHLLDHLGDVLAGLVEAGVHLGDGAG